ncbi:MAG TPA: prepilin peptidase, partial [Acidiferrobacteraceae bacterium]|nr:prepilin peptidase [Acidiferrobacteraceae bacterium]
MTALVLGLLIGSFLNVVILRLPPLLEHQWRAQCHALLETGTTEAPLGFNLAVPGSRCPQCQHPLSALENIPVVSYIALRGRCRACHHPISLRYPSIELLTGIL